MGNRLNDAYDEENKAIRVSVGALTSEDEVSTIHKPVASSTPANVNSSATSVTLFSSNANARTRSVFNDSTSAVYLKKGTTASATDYWVSIAPKGYFEFPLPIYTGRVDAIWDAANGAARTTEDA